MQRFILFWRFYPREVACLVLILGVAALLRFWALDHIPPGLSLTKPPMR
jgi:hypothetical protein